MASWYTIPTVGRLKATIHAPDTPNGSWAGWTWGLRPDNTNVLHVTDRRYAKLAAYQGNSKNLVYCPADKYVSPTQKKKGWSKRIRTFSMNSNMGEGNGKLWHGPSYIRFT